MTDPHRRQFISAAGTLAAAASLTSTSALASDSGCNTLGPVVHMVYFWLKNPDSSADRDALIAGLNSLKAIPQIQGLHVGVPASTLERDVIDSSYQVSELMLFNSTEDQDAYQTHPLHVKFVERCSHLWSKVVVYDSVSA